MSKIKQSIERAKEILITEDGPVEWDITESQEPCSICNRAMSWTRSGIRRLRLRCKNNYCEKLIKKITEGK